MWFSHSGKLGALLCPKTIEISAGPNCFIFSMILSALWCPNKCRKLKLIAIFVFGNDSDCCSAPENKHLPLIKHPCGHKESVRFLQALFHPPFIYWQCAIFATGKKVQTKQEMRGMHGKENASKEVLCHRWNFSFSPFFFLLHTFLWQSGTISRKGQWYWNKTRLFHSGSGTIEVTQCILLCLWPLF